jgi:hypothetical protein
MTLRIPPCSLRQGVGPRHARASRCAWLRSRLRRPCLPLRVAVMQVHGRDEEHGSFASGGAEQGTWVRHGMRGGQEAAFRGTFRGFVEVERPNCLRSSQAEPSTKKRPALRRTDRPISCTDYPSPGSVPESYPIPFRYSPILCPVSSGGSGGRRPPEECP